MSEYTYKDVIIDPDDPRAEIGKEYYFGDSPKEALEYANNNGRGALLEDIDLVSNFPFLMENFDESAPCLIRKKEPEKKYVPFDLSNKEDRARLRGAWIRPKDTPLLECQIYAIESDRIVVWAGDGYLLPKELLDYWTFEDSTPCGKLVEE